MPEPQRPPTCEIRDWTVFGPGYWRKALYSPADCARLVENFERLKGHVNPAVKLGHDRDQTFARRLKESWGFLNLGDFAAVTLKAGSRVAVSLSNVPTVIGGLVNAGRIRSGSVELIPYVADPDDASKRIAGPVITGVSLLGEEHPAVKGFAPPRAVFADGTPVPPDTDPRPWLDAMADVKAMAAFADEYDPTPAVFRVGGVEYPLFAAFSEYEPMIDEAFLKSLGLAPDQIAAIMAQQGGGGGAGAPPSGGAPPADVPPPPPPGGGGAPPVMDAVPPPPPGGGSPVPPPGGEDDKGNAPKKDALSQDDQTMMSAKAFAEMRQRVGAMEAKMSDAARREEAACSAAYAERVELVLNDPKNQTRVAPNMRAFYKRLGVDALKTKCFGDVADDAEKAFRHWKAFVESLPEAAAFSAAVDDSAPKSGGDSRFLQALRRPDGFLARHGATGGALARMTREANKK